MNTQEYIAKVKERKAKIGIVGLGYVGLPLALSFCRARFNVVGFDIDKAKIASLQGGKGYIHHISDADVHDAIMHDWLEPTTDFAHIKGCDAVILCVPTPLNRNREPDMTYIENTARSVAVHMRKEQLIVLESTTWPGTTDELLRPILESESRLIAGRDFALAFSPEREDPGNAKHNTRNIPKLVGGHTPACSEVASALYREALERVVPVSTTRVAEMSKLLENMFRSVNIALVNELKLLCDAMNINVWEVIEAAASKPFGFMPFYPGPGLGGHCIPIDPFYLTWKAREFEQPTCFIELAGEINTAMPHYVLERVTLALNERERAIHGARIMVYGVAYKRDIDDMRESPALKIIDLLQKRGARVAYHDKFVPELRRSREYDLGLRSLDVTETIAACFDAAVIVTDHSDVDYQSVCDWFPVVVDCRNATRAVSRHREKIVFA